MISTTLLPAVLGEPMIRDPNLEYRGLCSMSYSKRAHTFSTRVPKIFLQRCSTLLWTYFVNWNVNFWVIKQTRFLLNWVLSSNRNMNQETKGSKPSARPRATFNVYHKRVWWNVKEEFHAFRKIGRRKIIIIIIRIRRKIFFGNLPNPIKTIKIPM